MVNPVFAQDSTCPIPQNGPKPLNAEVTLTNQNFDEVFPATNWITTGNSNGKWDNDDYRYVSANCAAWPARSLRDPNSSVNDYFDNMDTRMTYGPFNITGAVVRDPYLYSYLTDAIKQGAMVVIRIYPSPGNFTDWASPGPNHTLLAGMTPAGGDYCNENFNNYRAIDDIAAEMNAIYQINTNLTNNWPASRFFFEPANELNKEWYDDLAKINPNLYPQIDRDTAWQAMDAYFSALYDNAKSFNSNLQILTPPMAQGLKAETREFPECNLTTLFVNDQPTNASGYDFMQNTYQTKNDGWSWHNYWRSGVEFWQGSLCQPSTTVSDHVFQYFPTWLQDFILQSTKPSFITEADLLSPCPSQSHVIVNKDILSNNAQESIWRFIDQEQGADYVAMWLLTNQYGDPPAPSSGQNVNCADGNSEIAWHEAYRDTPLSGVYERDWFPLWWLRNEASP